MSFIRLTTHAKERALERYAINPDTLLELAEKAVMFGIGYNDCENKRAKEWIKKHIRRDNNTVYVKGSYLFVFDCQDEYMVLITCLHVPNLVKAQIEGRSKHS